MALELKGRIKREHRQARSYSPLITAEWEDKSWCEGEGASRDGGSVWWKSEGKGHWSYHFWIWQHGRITSLHRNLREGHCLILKGRHVACWGWRITVTAPREPNQGCQDMASLWSLDLVSLSRVDLEHVSEIPEFTGFLPDGWLLSSLKQKLQTVGSCLSQTRHGSCAGLLTVEQV